MGGEEVRGEFAIFRYLAIILHAGELKMDKCKQLITFSKNASFAGARIALCASFLAIAHFSAF